MTNEELEKIYNSTMDSVNLLQNGKPDDVSDEEWQDIVYRNEAHIAHVKASIDWSSHGMSIDFDTNDPIYFARFGAKRKINQIRDSYIYGSVEFNGNTYQMDQQSIMDLMGAILAGVDTEWLTVDNVIVSLTVADLQQLGQVAAAYKKHYIYKARQHKDAIDALNTDQDIDDYMASLDWS